MKLEIPDAEMDKLLNALGQRPWLEINALLQSIIKQVTENKTPPPPGSGPAEE
jgi:hypothetical protein